MKEGSYRRSLLWKLVFFGLPIVAFAFMFKEVADWKKPRGGPAAVNEEQFAPSYQTTAFVLAALAAIPYLGLLFRFSDRILLTDTAIQRRRFFANRTLRWKDVIEYERFPNYIHVAPADESLGLYIDYYATFGRHWQLARQISRKCREVDANMASHRRRRRLVVCDLGIVPTAVFLVASALLLFFLRQRIIFLGFLSGIALTLVSAWIWLMTRRPLERWKSGGFVYTTLFLLFLMLPPVYFIQGIGGKGYAAIGTFGLLYLVGFLAGSGITSALLPSRRRR